MIVISNPYGIENEIKVMNALFEEGLNLLHIRKPEFAELEIAQFIHQIKLEHRNRLVLHNHHALAGDFGIDRIHFSEKERKSNTDSSLKFASTYTSTSSHSIEDFNSLEYNFDYAFLSPVFKSISKENYHPETDLFEALKKRNNYKTKVVALGGIDFQNITKILENGFDDFALLGSIWNNENPVKEFKLCQQIAHSYLQSQV